MPLSNDEFEARRAIFESIFAQFPAQDVKQKSRKEREEKELDQPTSKSQGYSEMDVGALRALFDLLNDKFGPLYAGEGTFLDLGSGAGKACIAAGLLHPFQKVVGIEVLDNLHDVASAAQTRYNDPEQVQLPEGVAKPEFQFIRGDFVKDFESQVAPLAPEVKVCLAVSTMYRDDQLQAMTKLANLMPEGSFFITVTHTIGESLIIDINKNPKQRRARAVKKALAKRGLEPNGIEIVMEPPVNEPSGWRQLFRGQFEMEWGTPTCFIFKKHLYPYCYLGDLCMVVLPAAENDSKAYLALWEPPTQVKKEDGDGEEMRPALQAVLFDDAFSEVREVGKIYPFSAEDREKALIRYSHMLEVARAAEAREPAAVVHTAMVHVRSELQLPDGEIHYAARGGTELTAEGVLLGKKLLAAYGEMGDEVWAHRFMDKEWPAACKHHDQHGSGIASAQWVAHAWAAVRSKMSTLLQGRLEKVEDFIPP